MKDDYKLNRWTQLKDNINGLMKDSDKWEMTYHKKGQMMDKIEWQMTDKQKEKKWQIMNNDKWHKDKYNSYDR